MCRSANSLPHSLRTKHTSEHLTDPRLIDSVFGCSRHKTKLLQVKPCIKAKRPSSFQSTLSKVSTSPREKCEQIRSAVKDCSSPGTHFLLLVSCSAVEAFHIRPSTVYAEQPPVHPALDQSVVYDNFALQILTSCIPFASLPGICSLDAPA